MSKLNKLDLRKYFLELQQNEGFKWIAIRSADLTKPCTECQNKEPSNNDQPQAYCKTCLGIGFSFTDKLSKGFRYQAAPGFDNKSNLGILNLKTQVYMLAYDANPKPVDWILELQLNEQDGNPVQPFKITNAFKIEDALQMRGDHGRIEFWRCFVRERNLDLGQRIA